MSYCPLYSGILAHQLIEADNKLYASLGVITLFVLGLLVFRTLIKIPKGLIASSFISYVLLLFNLLYCFFGLHIPESLKSLGNLCFAAGIWPSFKIICYVQGMADYLFGEEWLFESGWWVVFDGRGGTLCLLSFIINALVIFAIIRLFLYIKRKVSVKKPQIKT
jgi:hypothetical protein